MSQKKYKQLRREAEKHGIPYIFVKKAYRKLDTAHRHLVLAKKDAN
jgi:hypothetical protein